jgi:excisionase family DNA binding protein
MEAVLFDCCGLSWARDTVRYLANGSMMTEPWVSVEEVAKHLGVAKDSVYRWIETRHLPAHKVGRLWKFRLTEVDAWVKEQADRGPKPDSGDER